MGNELPYYMQVEEMDDERVKRLACGEERHGYRVTISRDILRGEPEYTVEEMRRIISMLETPVPKVYPHGARYIIPYALALKWMEKHGH